MHLSAKLVSQIVTDQGYPGLNRVTLCHTKSPQCIYVMLSSSYRQLLLGIG